PRAAGERLDREVAEREAIAGLAEDLSGVAVVTRKCAIEETREHDGAVGVDRVERVGRARAQVHRANAPAAVARNVAALDIRRTASIEIVARSGVAGRDAGTA